MYTRKVEPRRLLEELHDRDLIHNTWDVEAAILEAKNELSVREPDSSTISKIADLGKQLINNNDPYTIKVGVQLYRLAMWYDATLASEWIYKHATHLFLHTHPRVRHSTLWNIRAAVWQDSTLCEEAFSYAMKGLKDSDYAIQQVSMWIHGDIAINSPTMFEKTLASMVNMLNDSPKESNVLFALEEYFLPIFSDFKSELTYQEAVNKIHQFSVKSAGLNLRTSYLIGESYVPSIESLENVRRNLIERNSGNKIAELAESGDYLSALSQTLSMFNSTRVFSDRRSLLWTMRELVIIDSSLAETLYSSLIPLVMDKRDGDLVRIAIVILGTCVLLHPLKLAKIAVQTASQFFEAYDIDGSQIIMLQTLLPLLEMKQTRVIVRRYRSHFIEKSANKSVAHAVKAIFKQ